MNVLPCLLVVVLFVALLLCVACASRHGKSLEQEPFADQEADRDQIVAASLGTHSHKLEGADLSSSIAVSKAPHLLDFHLMVLPLTMHCTAASPNSMHLAGAAELVARGLFVSPLFALDPACEPVDSAESAHKFRVESPDTFDVSSLASPRKFRAQMHGVRANFEQAHLHMPSELSLDSFSTPELLKTRALPGVTVFMPPGSTECHIALRRLHASGGFIVLRISRADPGYIDVRTCMYQPAQKPLHLENAFKGLEFKSDGSYPFDSVQATPRHDGGLDKTEILGTSELIQQMVSMPAQSRVPVLQDANHTASPAVIQITPGVLRVAVAPSGPVVSARSVKTDEELLPFESERLGSDKVKPLQMLVRGGVACPFPCGDLVHFAQAVEGWAGTGT